MDKRVFKEFCHQVSKTIYLDLTLLSLDNYLIRNPKTLDKFTVTGRQCSCNYYGKTGIPCSHLLKVLITNRSSLIDTFEERWKIVTK